VFAPRTDDEFSKFTYVHHQKCASILASHGVSCIAQFPLDYVHLVCLGVTRRLLTFLKREPKTWKLSSRHELQISEKLILLHGNMSSEFARQPRSLIELDRWKATEFRQFLLYTGPVVLRGILPDNLYQHFLSLSIAISIMLDMNTAKRSSYLHYARTLITHFVWWYILYCDTFVVNNVYTTFFTCLTMLNISKCHEMKYRVFPSRTSCKSWSDLFEVPIILLPRLSKD
jgi:hypothetical protein